MSIVLEPGAEDLQAETESFTVTTDPQAFEAVRKALEDKGVLMETAQLQMVPKNLVKVAGKEAEQLLKLMEALEEHDDVQNVNSNFDIEEKELAALQNQS